MNVMDEPATEIQLTALRKFGYVPDHRLTRSEASHLLTVYQHPEENEEEPGFVLSPKTAHSPYHLRKVVEHAKLPVAQGPAREGNPAGDLNLAILQRQEFWIDTCRDVTKMHLAWPEIISLYRQHGCRFSWPTHEQVQEILDALDSALPTWDRDHPELFYQTLELNFPTLLQSR